MVEKTMLEQRVNKIIEIILEKESDDDSKDIEDVLSNAVAILTIEIVKLQIEIENLKCYVYKD